MSSQTISAPRDANHVPALLGTSSADGSTPVKVYADPVTHRLLVSAVSVGVASINGDTTSAQLLVVGTSGTDFAIVDNGTGTHTFNLPTASATNRGALSSADWTTFNNKGSGTVTTTGSPANGNLAKFSGATSVTNGDLTGDITTSGTMATTLATVNSNVGTFGSATAASVVTVNAKGLVTAASNTTVTPAVGSITGLGTGVATFLATPTSANLAAALTDETGTGANVFANKPTFLGTIQTITAVAALALDGSLGNIFTKTIGTGSTFTQSNFSTGQNFIVTVTGAFTITWFSGITWITTGAAAPTQAAITTYGFTCTGSNTFLGYLVGTQ